MRNFSKYDCNNIVLTTCNCVGNSKGTFGQPTVVLNTLLKAFCCSQLSK